VRKNSKSLAYTDHRVISFLRRWDIGQISSPKIC
jgi:hypothetical protein